MTTFYETIYNIMTKIKICGITNLEDALLAADLGADALGFIFVSSSPRSIAPETAREIVAKLPPFVSKVGVFVNQTKDYIRQMCHFCGLNVVQLHGDESAAFCRELECCVIKAFRVKNKDSLTGIPDYPANTFLLDTYKKNKSGGTGETFDWEIAELAKRYGRIILSGGLNPRNIRDAVRRVRPYAVDTASGVEAYPGRKDPDLLREFIERTIESREGGG